MSIYHDKIELVGYTFIRYRAMFIFILGMYTTFAKWNIYSVSVKYIFDYKVKFLRYTQTYSLNGRGRRGMICFFNSLNDLVSFRFVSQFTYSVSFLSLHSLFRFVSQFTDFASFRFVSFCCVSFLTLQGPPYCHWTYCNCWNIYYRVLL
jgi:hypothetical protein